MGDDFKSAMRAGWLPYIRKTYPDGASAAVDAIGEGTLALDNDWVGDALGLYAQLSPVVGCSWPVFCNEFTPKSQF